MRLPSLKAGHSGFTIVELAVVVAVIGILVTVMVFSFQRVQSQARDAKRASDIKIMSNALERYYIKNGYYPSGCGDTRANCPVFSFVNFPNSDEISVNTSNTELSNILETDLNAVGDPQATQSTKPFISVSYLVPLTQKGYVYRGGQTYIPATSGGTIHFNEYTEQGSSRSCILTYTFPTGSTAPNDFATFSIAYYSEVSKQWIINTGMRGIKPTLHSSSTPGFCQIQSLS